MASTLGLLRRLTANKVDFVLVGGMAAIVHGSTEVTVDVDVCIRFDEPTLRGLLTALAGTNPRERMHPARPPLSDAKAYVGYKNLYVTTDEGVIDLLSQLSGVGSFDRIVEKAVTIEVGGFPCRVVSVEDLITSKRLLGRPKDLRVVLELEAVQRATKK